MAHGDDRDHHPPCLIAWRDEASFHPVHPGRASAAAAPPMLPPPPIDPAAGYETLKRKCAWLFAALATPPYTPLHPLTPLLHPLTPPYTPLHPCYTPLHPLAP